MGESRLESGRGNFERNNVDVFEIVGSAIGPLKEATVRLVSFHVELKLTVISELEQQRGPLRDYYYLTSTSKETLSTELSCIHVIFLWAEPV